MNALTRRPLADAFTWMDEGWRPSGESWPGEARPELSFGRDLTVKYFTRSTETGTPEPTEPTVLWDSFQFHRLVEQWHEQRVETNSSISEIIACPAYLRIIAMGKGALPLIIEQLKNEGDDPDHWCAALEAITGENPVPEDAHGDTVRIAQAWIEWSKTSWIFRALEKGRTTESRALPPLSITALPGLPSRIHVGGGQAQEELHAVTGLQEWGEKRP